MSGSKHFRGIFENLRSASKILISLLHAPQGLHETIFVRPLRRRQYYTATTINNVYNRGENSWSDSPCSVKCSSWETTDNRDWEIFGLANNSNDDFRGRSRGGWKSLSWNEKRRQGRRKLLPNSVLPPCCVMRSCRVFPLFPQSFVFAWR